MPTVRPEILAALLDLASGLRQLEIDFCVIGALVPELLLEGGLPQKTLDADVAVTAADRSAFERLKTDLKPFRFDRTGSPHKLQHANGTRVDLLPFSSTIAPGGRLELERDLVLNMTGFDQVMAHRIMVTVADAVAVPVTPLPLYALLKLVAYSDRQAPRDLASVYTCLQRYSEEDERRYTLDDGGRAVPFEYSCAYLVGEDSDPFLDDRLAATVRPVLDRLDDPEGPEVATVAREHGLSLLEEAYRLEIHDRFHYFRRGAGL